MAENIEQSYAKTLEDVNDPKKGIRQFASQRHENGDPSYEVDECLKLLEKQKSELVVRVKELREAMPEFEKDYGHSHALASQEQTTQVEKLKARRKKEHTDPKCCTVL